MSACQCAACGESFTGVRSFDQHQAIRYDRRPAITCRPPASLGMIRNRHGRWGLPPDPAKPNPFASR